jgi:hypothetical protein
VAFELEDLELFAKKKKKTSPTISHTLKQTMTTNQTKTDRSKSAQPSRKRPAIRQLSPSRLNPSYSSSHYQMVSVTTPSDSATGREEEDILRISAADMKEVPKSMIKRRSKEDGGLMVYYFRSTTTTKRALISLVSADDFKGQVKISEPHLQKAILKLSDEDLVAAKAELSEVPGASVVIERAELRLQNAKLQKLLDQMKK